MSKPTPLTSVCLGASDELMEVDASVAEADAQLVPIDWAEYDAVQFVAIRVEEIGALDFEEDTFAELMLALGLCVTNDIDADMVWVVTKVMTDDGAVTVTVVTPVHGQFVIVV